MAIYINDATQVLVQGITGKQGSFHGQQMLAYGTKVVAGVSPGKAGQKVHGIPVYDTVSGACAEHSIQASIIIIPAPFAKDAALEAFHAGIKLVVIITEHIPVHDAMTIMAQAKIHGATVVGPNTFGLVSSGLCKIGIMPNNFFKRGNIGIVARSGTLSYEIVVNLREAGYGTSTVVGLGGDRIVGLSFVDVLQEFERDEETEAIVLIGEIGGNAEEEAAEYIKKTMKTPVLAYLAGKSAPEGKTMGHAGAIIERGKGTFASKVNALREAGVPVADLPFEVPKLIEETISGRRRK